jgi:hypothetical protein
MLARKPGGKIAMDDRDRLMALHGAHRRLAQAQEVGDIATLESLLSLGYQHTDRFGKRWSRKEWLAQIKPEPKPPTAMDLGHLSTLLKGDLGIVTGIRHLYLIGPREDEQEPATAFTQLWIWQDGCWLRELFQATPIVDLEAI